MGIEFPNIFYIVKDAFESPLSVFWVAAFETRPVRESVPRVCGRFLLVVEKIPAEKIRNTFCIKLFSSGFNLDIQSINLLTKFFEIFRYTNKILC